MPSYSLQEITANGELICFDSATLNVHPEENQWWIQVRTKTPLPRHLDNAEAKLKITTSDARRFAGRVVTVAAPDELTGTRRSQLLLVLLGQGDLRRSRQ